MLLRSSSTPVLGSLLPPFSDTPNNNIKSPYHQISCLNLSTTTVNSCTSSPSISESSDHFSRKGGVIRRAQSESNLEGLDEDCQLSSQPKKISFSGRQKCLILETIPSFSCYNLKNRIGEEDCDEGDDDEDDDGSEFYMEEEERVQMVANSGLSLMERNWEVEFEEQNGFINEEMYLARGLGIGGGGGGGGGGGRVGGGGGGGGFRWAGGDGGGERQDTEEYYKKMVQENPGNSLFLRNYAQFLYQTKGDLHGAEEYYSRAILTDPEDGEILSQYAKLVWELHHDLDRASSYFERAVRASPADSHVHAAYASFLWETEEDEDECNAARDFDTMSPHFHGGVMASTHA